MKKISLLAMVVGFIFIGAVNINLKLSFRDIHFGMDVNEARELAKGYNEVGVSVGVDSCQDTTSNNIICGASKGKVWLISVSAWNSDAERLKIAVFKKYGKPTKEWATSWQTLFGTAHKGISAEWHIVKDVVTFEYRPTDIVNGELEWGGFLKIMSSEYLMSLKKPEMKF